MKEPGRRGWGLDAARVFALLVAAGTHAVWVASLIEVWGTPELGRRDYAVFHAAGRAVLEGGVALERVYDAPVRGFPFLHPPPVLGLSAPLGLLPLPAAYLVVVLATLTAAALALTAIFRLSAPAERRGFDVVVLTLVASAPWMIGLALGQPIALALFSWAAAALALRGRRPVLAGLLMSACALKPTLMLAPLAWWAVRRRWRALAGAGIGLVALASLGAVAGLDRYADWLAASGRVTASLLDGNLALYKQHTLLAWLLAVAPSSSGPFAWAALAFPAGLLTLRELARTDPERAPLAGLGLCALGTIALSPYAYYYDAVLLLFAGASLRLAATGRMGALHVAVGAAAFAVFAAEHITAFLVRGGVPWAGGLVALWLALELLHRDRIARAGVSSP